MPSTGRLTRPRRPVAGSVPVTAWPPPAGPFLVPRTISVLVPVILLSCGDLVDHALEVIDVVDAQPDQRVGVAREGERLHELGKIGDRRSISATWRRRAKRSSVNASRWPPSMRVVEHGGVAAHDAEPLQRSMRRLAAAGRQVDAAADLARRTAAVLDEQLEDPPVDGVERFVSHGENLTSKLPQTRRYVRSLVRARSDIVDDRRRCTVTTRRS